MLGITWQQDSVAGVSLNRHACYAGAIEVGWVMYDGSNRLWIWSSPLAEDAWGYGPSEEAAKHGFEVWLATWLENFRPFFEAVQARRQNPSCTNAHLPNRRSGA